jgi:hypothetical protein
MPGWCRSPYLLIPALCIWALVPIWVSHAFPQRPFERIGAEIILGGAMLMYWAWLQGWRKTLTETVPFFVTMYAAITITYRAPFSDHTLSGSFYSLLVVTAAATLYVLYLSLLGAALTRKSTGRPYWAEVRAGLRASCVAERSWAEIRAEQRARRPPRRSWAEIRAEQRARRPPRRSWAEIRAEVHARQQRPRISVAWVKAPDLHVQILHVERVVFDEFAAAFHVLAHQRGEDLFALRRRLPGAPDEQGALFRIHGGLGQVARRSFRRGPCSAARRRPFLPSVFT